MAQKRILAADDEPRYLKLMRVNLESAGFAFRSVSDGAEAVEALAKEPYDLVILDVLMPELGGFETIQSIREFSDVPIIFVTALGEEANKIKGLNLGADDYLTKPFSANELLARVEAVLRRTVRATSAESVVEAGDLRVDFAQHRVFRGEAEIRLSRMEYRLLALLMRNLGKVVPQDQLVHQVWGSSYNADFEGLRVYIYRLRQKLERDPDRPEYVQTFPGVGYVLQPSPLPA